MATEINGQYISQLDPATIEGTEEMAVEKNGKTVKVTTNKMKEFAQQGVVKDPHYVHTDNNFTQAEKEKLAGITPGGGVDPNTYATKQELKGKADKTELPTKTSQLQNDSDYVTDPNYHHTDNNFTNEEKQKLAGIVPSEGGGAVSVPIDVLLDETSTNDKAAGAKAVVQKLAALEDDGDRLLRPLLKLKENSLAEKSIYKDYIISPQGNKEVRSVGAETRKYEVTPLKKYFLVGISKISVESLLFAFYKNNGFASYIPDSGEPSPLNEVPIFEQVVVPYNATHMFISMHKNSPLILMEASTIVDALFAKTKIYDAAIPANEITFQLVLRAEGQCLNELATGINYNGNYDIFKIPVKPSTEYIIEGIFDNPIKSTIAAWYETDYLQACINILRLATGEDDYIDSIFLSPTNAHWLFISVPKKHKIRIYEKSDGVEKIKAEENSMQYFMKRNMKSLAHQFIYNISPFVVSEQNLLASFYCCPDIHLDFDYVQYHKLLFTESGRINKNCNVAITAGDMFYSGQGYFDVPIRQSCADFLTAVKDFNTTGVSMFPAIGGHDFNNKNDMQHAYDEIGENLTKGEQRELIIQTCINEANKNLKINIAPYNGGVDGICYYEIIDDLLPSRQTIHFIILDEHDHPNIVIGTYNGVSTKMRLTSVDFVKKTFNGTSMDGGTPYTNIPFGDFKYYYTRYSSNSYQQAQMNWFINTLKSIPQYEKVCVFNHSGFNGELTDNAGTAAAMKEILKAFVKRTTYKGKGNDDVGLTWSVDVDFSASKGELIGLFRGHAHGIRTELIDGTYYEFMSSCGGVKWNNSDCRSLQGCIDGDLFLISPKGATGSKNFTPTFFRLHYGRKGRWSKPWEDKNSDYTGLEINGLSYSPEDLAPYGN